MAEARSQGAWWLRGSESRRAARSKPSGHVNGGETVTVVLGGRCWSREKDGGVLNWEGG